MAGSFSSLDWQPPLFLFAHLAGRALERRLAEERSSDDGGIVAWIGRRVWPYPRTLVRIATPIQLGQRSGHCAGTAPLLDDETRGFELELPRRRPGSGSADGNERAELLTRSMFIDPGHDRGRLWAIDVALRSKAVAAVVADASRLPIAATRRLQLAARAGEALCLLARPPWEVRELSCATTRFLVRRRPGHGGRDGKGELCWSVQLLRAKGAAQSLAS